MSASATPSTTPTGPQPRRNGWYRGVRVNDRTRANRPRVVRAGQATRVGCRGVRELRTLSLRSALVRHDSPYGLVAAGRWYVWVTVEDSARSR